MFKALAEMKTLVLKRPFRISRGSKDSQSNVFLTLTDGSLTGIGESALKGFGPETLRLHNEEFARAQEIADNLNTEPQGGLAEIISAVIPDDCPTGLRCAAETAICDLVGQKSGLPVWKLLGLDPGPQPISSFTLGIDEPEVMKEKLEEAADMPVLKIKLGGDYDRKIIPMLRRATDKVIRVDANGGWTVQTAPEMIRMCADNDVEFIEQPLPEGMITESARLADKSPLPILLDEDCKLPADAEQIAGKVHGVNVKLRKSGGLWTAFQTIKTARKHGLKVMIGCFIESSLGITAAAQLGSLADWLDLDGHVLITNDPYQGLTWNNGEIILPGSPGLGVSPAQT